MSPFVVPKNANFQDLTPGGEGGKMGKVAAVAAFLLCFVPTSLLGDGGKWIDDQFYITEDGVITNIPTSRSRFLTTAKIRVATPEEKAWQEKVDKVIAEVRRLDEDIKKSGLTPDQYMSTKYVGVPDVFVIVTAKEGGRDYTITGRHARLKGYCLLNADGSLIDNFERD